MKLLLITLSLLVVVGAVCTFEPMSEASSRSFDACEKKGGIPSLQHLWLDDQYVEKATCSFPPSK